MILEEKTLYPGKFKNIFLLLISIIFTVGGIFMLMDGETFGWFVSGFFGICLIVAIIGLLPNANYLKLDKNGFEMCTLFKKSAYRWEDIQLFRSGKVHVKTMVMFNFSEDFQKHKTMRKVNAKIAGKEGALPDTYGLKAEELADLMNDYRQKHTTTNDK